MNVMKFVVFKSVKEYVILWLFVNFIRLISVKSKIGYFGYSFIFYLFLIFIRLFFVDIFFIDKEVEICVVERWI